MSDEIFVEIGTEEIPARFIDPALAALAAGMDKLLGNIPHGAIHSYGTPRRLVVVVEKVGFTRPSNEKLITGPAAHIAFKDGQLTPAGEAFARKQGVPGSLVQIMEGPKGPIAGLYKQEGGEATADVVAAGLEALILGIPFKKTMRWCAGNVKFARPILYVCARFGNRLIETRVAGMPTTLHSRGHRLLHPEPFEFKDHLDWLSALRQRSVLADPGERRGETLRQLRRKAEELGMTPEFDAELLAEVVNLVEVPHVIVGQFDAALLELPPRLLVESMKKHQRYFPLYQNGVLSNHFLIVSNNPFGDDALIASGNARVLAARFYDARFFYSEDRAQNLETHGQKLQQMTWIRGLGTMAARQERLALAGAELAPDFGANPADVARAAQLCKADLSTQMVGEFPELQGHVGRLLAQLQGEKDVVALAIEEHYLPRGAGDVLPQSPEGSVLALAERLTLLSQTFALGIRPTASSDAQGLRRAAQGLLQILLGLGHRCDIRSLFDRACAENRGPLHQELADFMQARLRALLTSEGTAADIVDAVLATSGMDLVYDALRVRALGKLAEDGSFAPIRITFKRATGLVKAHAFSSYETALFSSPVEWALHNALIGLPDDGGDVARMLEALAGLRPQVDQFFDGVLVMCEDLALRNNRLGLLKAVTERFSRLADFSRLSSE